MGKLFDLMIMGFKLQLMSVAPRETRGKNLQRGRWLAHFFGPTNGDLKKSESVGSCRSCENPKLFEEIIDVTNNHLEELRRLAGLKLVSLRRYTIFLVKDRQPK